MFLGDFNINISPGVSALSPRCLQLMDWITIQELCLLNMDNLTRTGPSSQTSLMELTLLSHGIYYRISYFVHPALYDSDHYPIVLFSSHSALEPPHHVRPRWNLESVSFNKLSMTLSSSDQTFENMCTHTNTRTSARIQYTARSHCPWWDTTCGFLLNLKWKFLLRARSLCSKED